MDSILQPDTRECYLTGATHGLHKHHVYHGHGLRQISEANGFWVWLRWDWHNGREYGVHGRDGHILDQKLKQECQEKFEETHSRAEFRRLIGRSYL